MRAEGARNEHEVLCNTCEPDDGDVAGRGGRGVSLYFLVAGRFGDVTVTSWSCSSRRRDRFARFDRRASENQRAGAILERSKGHGQLVHGLRSPVGRVRVGHDGAPRNRAAGYELRSSQTRPVEPPAVTAALVWDRRFEGGISPRTSGLSLSGVSDTNQTPVPPARPSTLPATQPFQVSDDRSVHIRFPIPVSTTHSFEGRERTVTHSSTS